MSLWAADSHVHFHKCFEVGIFFDKCFHNLSKINLSTLSGGFLFFTEGKNEKSYDYLRQKTRIKSNNNTNSEYILNQNETGNTIEVRADETGRRIFIFPGFQIVTKENLEVLSLGTQIRLNDGQPIEDTIEKVISIGGIPVLPWGFGKWYGSRGQIIYDLISKKKSLLFLGDNGGRSNLLQFPKQFTKAHELGIPILPGSDPLPFPNEVARPLSYGFLINCEIHDLNPWESVKRTLLNNNFKFEEYGKLTAPLSFIKTQISMQIKKRINK